MVVYLGIGSNLGNRRDNIKQAVKQINLLKNTRVLKISNLISTDPLGGPPNQPEFLNAALKINTTLSPVTLLKKLKIIEKSLGRVKTVRNGPRTIDLDILLYADKIIRNKYLTIPHRAMFKRNFVIESLSEII